MPQQILIVRRCADGKRVRWPWD